MDSVTRANRVAWEAASAKYVREYEDLLAQAAAGSSLTAAERDLLAPVLRGAPEVVHPQSGHGLEDVALVRAGARSVVGIDYSTVAAGAAQRRADDLGVACRYIVASVPQVPLADASADLIYTGKGALGWMPDLTGWAAGVTRLLRPSGYLFIYEAHPASDLWTWDEDRPRIREDRDYFGRSHVNDSFPGRGAVQWQWTLGQIVTAIASAGLRIVHLSEYAEPFWRMGGVSAAAWDGRLPNAFDLLARLLPPAQQPGPGGGQRDLRRLVSGGLVDWLGGEQQAEQDRRDQCLEYLVGIGAGRKFAAVDGPGDDRSGSPEAVFGVTAPDPGDLRQTGGVGGQDRSHPGLLVLREHRTDP
jgi:SAM-dependent methyltransferase